MRSFQFIQGICLLVCTILVSIAHAQSQEEQVKKVITNLFAAMHQADSAGLVACFAPNAHMETIKKGKESADTIVSNSVFQFGASIARQPAGALDERITFGHIEIDEDLAIVWTPYQFYFKENFSHCGVNSFQLVRLQGQWKIQYIIDTRRKENCL